MSLAGHWRQTRDHMDGSPLSEISERPNKYIRGRRAQRWVTWRKMTRKSSWLGVLKEKGLSLYVLVYISACTENWRGSWAVDLQWFPSHREQKENRKTSSLIRTFFFSSLCFIDGRWTRSLWCRLKAALVSQWTNIFQQWHTHEIQFTPDLSAVLIVSQDSFQVTYVYVQPSHAFKVHPNNNNN